MLNIPEGYIEQCSSGCPAYLFDLERETHLKVLKPHMLTGFAQGRLLSLLSSLKKPSRILEIGTFTGYGTLCLAEGLDSYGKIMTIENSEENIWLARKYFSLSPFSGQIEIKMGRAEEWIEKLEEIWDLVYLDADKINNEKYLKIVWPKVASGGLVLIDNVFAHGTIWKEEKKPFEEAVASLNLKLPDLLEGVAGVTMLPIRDGLTVIRKN
jgi:predicted O-methyltransferase YrrM